MRSGKLDVRTLVCDDCYRVMVRSSESCFAKEYQATAIECRSLCPDRKVCPKWGKTTDDDSE